MIHSSGIVATFWLRCVVTDESSSDPHAARPTHKTRSYVLPRAFDDVGLSDAFSLGAASAGTSRTDHAIAERTSESTVKPIASAVVCSRRLQRGSMRNGYASKDSSEPMFDTAK